MDSGLYYGRPRFLSGLHMVMIGLTREDEHFHRAAPGMYTMYSYSIEMEQPVWSSRSLSQFRAGFVPIRFGQNSMT